MTHRNFQALCLKLAVPALAFAMVLPAFGSSVTYSTTGTFTCTSCTGSGSNTVSFTGGDPAGTLTISFAGVSGATVGVPGHGSGGAVTVSTSSNTTGTNAPVDITAGSTFALTIHQTSPSNATGSLSGALEGSIGYNNSSGDINFTSTQLTLGDIVYTLTNLDGNAVDLVPPNTNGGVSTIQLQLTASPVPEPTFLSLTALGFAGMGVFAFRRRRRAE